jgi:hypothetical protein
MTEQLFNLLDSLMEKQFKINDVLDILGGTVDEYFLTKEIKMIELMIVKSMGGNEGHYNHIDTTELFYNFENSKNDEGNKAELIAYIEETIENDWQDEEEVTFRRA